MLHESLKVIRTQLRMAMNGVASGSMREKGMLYKLNFGVSLTELKQIASRHEPCAELAAALWKEDIREFKILASMLQPADNFPIEQARMWVRDIPYPEIAEQCCRNLFARLPYVEVFLRELIADKESGYTLTVAYLTWAELLKAGKTVDAALSELLLTECMRSVAFLDAVVTWKERQAAVTAMKFYGRRSEGYAREVLSGFDRYPKFMKTPEGQETYNDLKFEFEYYR